MKARFIERERLPGLGELQALTWWMIRIALLMAVGMTVTPGGAQTTLNTVTYAPFAPADRTLRADFSLPQAGAALPQVDPVVSVDVFAGDVHLGADKVVFTKTEKIPNYRCAILLLADKNLGKRLWHAARETLSQLAVAAETSPYKLELAAISAGNLEVLAPMDSKRGIFDQAIENLNFNGSSPELYLGIKRGIEALSGIAADRKYIILISSGISDDQVTSQGDVINAAHDAKIHLCTIGFPGSSESAEAVQKLEPLAEQTGGYSVRADGRDLRLPADSAGNILRFVVSGGLVEVDLAGLKSPVKLDFKVQTEYKRAYGFTHTVDNLPPVPTPTPAPTPLASSTPAPRPSLNPPQPPIPVVTPVSSPLEIAKSWIGGHRILSAVGGLVVLALVGLVLAGFFLKRKKPPIVLPEPTFRSDEEPAFALPILAWLETLDSEQTRYPITKSAVRIGRLADNDIVMKNDTVSGHHAEIVRKGSQFIIADLESSNNVLVGGKRIEKAALQDGDIVELGEVRLRFIEQSSNSLH
jgi:FHA domain